MMKHLRSKHVCVGVHLCNEVGGYGDIGTERVVEICTCVYIYGVSVGYVQMWGYVHGWIWR